MTNVTTIVDRLNQPAAGPTRVVLDVNLIKKYHLIVYTVVKTSSRPPVTYEMDVPRDEQCIAQELDDLRGFLRDAARYSPRSETAKLSLLVSMRAKGQAIFEKLIPHGLAEEIRTWHDGIGIALSTNENWIPWELLFDGSAFLSDRFMLFRQPRIQNGYATERHGRHAGCAVKILHVIGGGLDKYEADCMRHFGRVNARIDVKAVCKQMVAAVLAELPHADIVHFTCHGRMPEAYLQTSDMDTQTYNLTLDIVSGTQCELKEDCIVFANACHSAAATSRPGLGDFNSFGWAFYLKGAAVFVGTLGTVPTEFALSFAQEFYNALVVEHKTNIDEAFRRAKQAVDQISPLHRMYCFYADPGHIPAISLA